MQILWPFLQWDILSILPSGEKWKQIIILLQHETHSARKNHASKFGGFFFSWYMHLLDYLYCHYSTLCLSLFMYMSQMFVAICHSLQQSNNYHAFASEVSWTAKCDHFYLTVNLFQAWPLFARLRNVIWICCYQFIGIHLLRSRFQGNLWQ